MVPTGYEICEAVDLVAQICLHYIQTGEMLYGEGYKKYTKNSQYFPYSPYARTKTITAAGHLVFIGYFGADGLFVYYDVDDYLHDDIGLAVSRRNS